MGAAETNPVDLGSPKDPLPDFGFSLRSNGSILPAFSTLLDHINGAGTAAIRAASKFENSAFGLNSELIYTLEEIKKKRLQYPPLLCYDYRGSEQCLRPAPMPVISGL